MISLGRTLTLDLYASAPLARGVIPQTSLSDASYPSLPLSADGENAHILLPPPTAEEIATYFSLIHPLKYSQSHQPLGSPFSPPLNGLTITAYCSGHTLGGSIWHIQHGLESIVYAVDWNQARENVIPGAAWLGGGGGGEVTEQLRKPTAMICSARGAAQTALSGGRRKRDERLLSMIRRAVARGGNVLIPTDSSARVIELAYLLEHAWRAELAKGDADKDKDDEDSKSFRHAKLYLAAKSAGSTMRYARSMLEWMEEGVVREFESEGTAEANARQRPGRSGDDRDADQPSKARAGPFDFRHLQLIERPRDVAQAFRRVAKARDRGQPSAAVVLASDASLEWGLSRDVLRQLASDDRNLVILTECHGELGDVRDQGFPSVSRKLWGWWQQERRRDGPDATLEQDVVSGNGREMELREPRRTTLEANELLVYQQHLATRKQLHTMLPQEGNAGAVTSLDNIDDASSDDSTSSDESDSEQQGKALNTSAALASSSRSKMQLTDRELGVNILLRRKGIHDFFVRGKKGRERMFPFVARRRRVDAFGETIRPDEFLKAEERDDAEGQQQGKPGSGKDQARPALGQKRKWGDVESGDASGRRPGPSASGTAKAPRGAQDQAARAQPGGRDDGARANGVDTSDDEDVSGESDAEGESEPTIGPSKLVFRNERIALRLGIGHVDFGGIHDKRSLQMLIPLIEPRKLILVEGSKEETTLLAEDCRRLLKAKSGGSSDEADNVVFTPVVGRTVDASVDTNAWTVRLSEALVKRLRWQHVRNLSVVHVNGHLSAMAKGEDDAETEQGSNKRPKIDGQETALSKGDNRGSSREREPESPPVLDVVPPALAATHRSVTQPLHVGDIRLADLKRSLQGSGHVAEFRGEGTLLVDGLVSVRKLGTGKMEVEGDSLSTSHVTPDGALREGIFNHIKRRIYEGLAVVAGA